MVSAPARSFQSKAWYLPIIIADLMPYKTIQLLNDNYIRDGFWAKNNSEELPNPGLFVTFIIRMEDVTKQILNGVTTDMSERERQSQVDKNIDELRKDCKKGKLPGSDGPRIF